MLEFLHTNTGFHDIEYWQIGIVLSAYLISVIYDGFVNSKTDC